MKGFLQAVYGCVVKLKSAGIIPREATLMGLVKEKLRPKEALQKEREKSENCIYYLRLL